MADDFSERTEQATPRKREKARQEGQVARSSEFTSMCAIGGILLFFYFAGAGFFKKVSEIFATLLSIGYGRDPIAVINATIWESIILLMPFMIVSVGISLLVGGAQVGLKLTPLKFNVEAINPISGIGRFFSKTGFINTVKSIIKAAIGLILFYFLIKKMIPEFITSLSMDFSAILNLSLKLISKSVFYAFGLFFVISMLDYLAQRWQFESSLKMTKQEIKEESKQTEGDPMIKARVRSIQKEMARRRMMAEVPKATVVITNPTHLAIALKYDKESMSAPKIVAKGADFLAQKIREVAKENGVPIYEDKPLARTLYKLNLDSEIPYELYKAVAKILAYIKKFRETKYSGGWN